jgi:hypothetical protein
MKKYVLSSISFVMIFASVSVSAQDNGSSNLFHFGLKIAPALSWFTPGETMLAGGGPGLGFSYGLTTEFGFTKNYAFSTGLEILNANGKLKFTDSTLYTLPDATHPKMTDTFLLQKRTYKLRYVDIPLLLKLKTNKIGAMTYFGQFGFDLAVLWKATADDNVTGVTTSNTDIDISKDVNFIRLALNVGLGLEYNLAGTTSFMLSINYDNGFINALKKNSETLFAKNFNTPFPQNAVFNYIGLNIGILF